MQIRDASPDDWPRLWPLVKEVVDAGETYAWSPTPSPDEMRSLWLEPAPWKVFVAEVDGQIVGSAKVGPNRPGRGAHVATASFMVGAGQRGQGVGRSLGEFVVDLARNDGFLAIQFNAVVETNNAAISLWRSLGFDMIGTVPRAFDHPLEGLVGLHIMYRQLDVEPVRAQL